jgi:hypothetical protein
MFNTWLANILNSYLGEVRRQNIFNNLSPKNFLQPDLAVDKVFARHPMNLCAEQSHKHCMEISSYKRMDVLTLISMVLKI